MQLNQIIQSLHFEWKLINGTEKNIETYHFEEVSLQLQQIDSWWRGDWDPHLSYLGNRLIGYNILLEF